MTRWRVTLAMLLLLGAGVPLFAPIAELAAQPEGWQALQETGRLLELAGNSLLLVVCTLLVALPLGTVGAVLLFRTDLPGKSFWRFLSTLSLFVPLPLVTSAWQMALGRGPEMWLHGMAGAVWIHAAVAIPWVVVLFGLGLSWVEPELEEDALTAAPTWRVFRHVTLVRSRPALLLAAVWAAVLTLSEITVTDLMQVRTFSEETYLQFNTATETEVARAMAISLPMILLTCLLAFIVLNDWRRTVPSRQVLLRGPLVFSLGKAGWPLAVAMAAGSLVLVGVPLLGLVKTAGIRYATPDQPGPPTWDGILMLNQVLRAFTQHFGLLVNNVLFGLGAGAITSLLALVLCWLSRGSRWFELLVWILAAALWAVPGPVLGVGLHATILAALDLPGGRLAALLLYEHPSPLPNMWVCTLRFLPVAVATLWPLVRLIPLELEELAILDGAGPWQRFRHVIFPIMRAPLLWVTAGVAVLTLGEVSASKLVTTSTTAAFTPLAHHVFMQLHASADAPLAALCLVLLSLIVLAGSAVAACRRLAVRSLEDTS